MTIAEGYVFGNRRVKIKHYIDPESPREWSNVGTMACFHSRYTLGDKHDMKEPGDLIQHLVREVGLTHDDLLPIVECFDEYEKEDYDQMIEDDGEVDLVDFVSDSDDLSSDVNSKLMEIVKSKGLVILPLNLYDHGGISMSTSSFSCPWDSGQVGWIYATPAAIKENFIVKDGETPDDIRERATACLESEVETYNAFLTGQVYGFEVETYINPDREVIELDDYDFSDRELENDDDFDLDDDTFFKVVHEDSCWGFYSIEDAKAEANSIVNYLNKEAAV